MARLRQRRGVRARCAATALQGAVAHEDGPAAGLAENDGSANGPRLDEALDGLSVDDFRLRRPDRHLTATFFKFEMRNYLVGLQGSRGESAVFVQGEPDAARTARGNS